MTGAPQDASRIIASSDCCYRLERFARDLVKLCAKYDFHVHALRFEEAIRQRREYQAHLAENRLEVV